MKKILLVAPYGGVPGGISRWTSHIVEYHNTCKCNDYLLELVPMGRSMFVNINMSVWKRLWSAWIDYRKIFSDFNKKIKSGYDIMHLTSSGSLSLYKDLYMIHQARKHGLKSIIHFHFGRIPELTKQNTWEWKLIKKAILMADEVIVLDQLSHDTLVSLGFKNINILPNPVAPKVEEIIAENKSVIPVPKQLLFTGHVVKTKGIFELLKVCSMLDDIHLKVVGHITSDMQHEIEYLYGKPEWLTICGEMPYENVIKEMMQCDVFVLPTYTEGFPNVILEAMSAGCAIVSTPVGAIPQMLQDDENGKYGLLVAPQNVTELYNTIKFLLDDETVKYEIRRNVRARVKDRYNIQSVWNKLSSIWEYC